MPGLTLDRLPLGGGGTLGACSGKRWWHALLRRMAVPGTDVFGVRLSAGQELQLHDVAGLTLACESGAVWITQEGDSRDIFLKGGEGFALDRGGLAIVRACRGATVTVRVPFTFSGDPRHGP
jgi:hypothetical protein